MRIAAFDIGGANTDLAVVEFDEKGQITEIITDFTYLPMWREKEELSHALLDLLKSGNHKKAEIDQIDELNKMDELNEINEIDAVGVCMTAELVDAYKTKKEGVLDIAWKVEDTFNPKNALNFPLGFVGLDGMINYQELQKNPLQVAAANWIATSTLAAKISPDCVMIDTGSTTTDIIPIKDGKECAQGRSDLERLKTGELVYSGTLRTNVAALVDKVPLDGSWARVASELFAQSADVHLVLGNITEEDYNCETPDGSGKSPEECMRRISRVVCGDLDVLSHSDIEEMADFIYKKQVEEVSLGLQEVLNRHPVSTIVTTGLGMDIIAAKASELAGIKSIGMDELLSKEECVVAPAVGTAVLMEEFLRSDD